jgi:Flp pilus assembly pilin Flp
MIERFVADASGSTAIEYALIAAGIVAAAYASMQVAGALTSGLFGTAIFDLTVH